MDIDAELRQGGRSQEDNEAGDQLDQRLHGRPSQSIQFRPFYAHAAKTTMIWERGR
ncbi:hypothetical protein [uncultured Brevundimonas sp.]|uniref:hypothetical protein n=1 Tax=uncultured Brevundimonas sp. TaxID=213418 RepID=UPI0025F9EE11|nr:hypothetical protein [uncultured Brevundimonas sp.]